MLEEEKQRKTFNTQLPKLEEELNQLTNEYRELNGGTEFTVYGLSFTEYVHTKRVDYEESKELERKEKQILRDTIKKNETRFGSKPATPLALRNKRNKLAGMQDTHVNTPGAAAHRSKLQRTELGPPAVFHAPNTPSSRVVNVARGLNNTPGKAMNGQSVKVVTSRAIGNTKRKSRTPGKSKYVFLVHLISTHFILIFKHNSLNRKIFWPQSTRTGLYLSIFAYFFLI